MIVSIAFMTTVLNSITLVGFIIVGGILIFKHYRDKSNK